MRPPFENQLRHIWGTLILIGVSISVATFFALALPIILPGVLGGSAEVDINSGDSPGGSRYLGTVRRPGSVVDLFVVLVAGDARAGHPAVPREFLLAVGGGGVALALLDGPEKP